MRYYKEKNKGTLTILRYSLNYWETNRSQDKELGDNI
jgi:hypothetical protein